MSDKETENTIEGNDSFTDADIELTSTLHSLLNDVIIAIKDEEFNREELEEALEEAGDEPYGKEDAIDAYQRVGGPLMKFAAMLNNAVLESIFEGIDPEEIVIEECDSACDCESSEDTTSDTPSA
jgi:hypothetical protein